MKREEIILKIVKERAFQSHKHPSGFKVDRWNSKWKAMAVLSSEVGELSTAFLREDLTRQREEAIQVAAVAFRILEEIL